MLFAATVSLLVISTNSLKIHREYRMPCLTLRRRDGIFLPIILGVFAFNQTGVSGLRLGDKTLL